VKLDSKIDMGKTKSLDFKASRTYVQCILKKRSNDAILPTTTELPWKFVQSSLPIHLSLLFQNRCLIAWNPVRYFLSVVFFDSIVSVSNH
jgi:hypothetical protein